MSDTASPELEGGLPVGFYEQLRTPLTLTHIVCHHVFQHPHTALAQETTALTRLDAGFVATMHLVSDNASLAAVMQQQPLPFLWYLRLGQQLLTSPLGQQLIERLQHYHPTPPPEPAGSAPAPAAQLLEHFLYGLRILEQNFATYLVELNEDAAAELELGALQLEGIVARQLPSLPPLPHVVAASDPQPESPAAAAAGAEQAEDIAARMTFQEPQLQVMRLAATLPEVLPDMVNIPFTQGLASLAAFQSPLLPQLRQRLLAAAPEEPLGFTLPELALLFRCAQVCAMAMLQPELEQFLLAGAGGAARLDAEAASQVRRVLAVIVSGFVELLQREYGHEPELTQARHDIDTLADLL